MKPWRGSAVATAGRVLGRALCQVEDVAHRPSFAAACTAPYATAHIGKSLGHQLDGLRKLIFEVHKTMYLLVLADPAVNIVRVAAEARATRDAGTLARSVPFAHLDICAATVASARFVIDFLEGDGSGQTAMSALDEVRMKVDAIDAQFHPQWQWPTQIGRPAITREEARFWAWIERVAPKATGDARPLADAVVALVRAAAPNESIFKLVAARATL